ARTGRPGPGPRLGAAGVRCLAFAPPGGILAAGGVDGTVGVWDLAAGRPRLAIRAHSGPLKALEFAGDGSVLASASCFDDAARLGEIDPGRLRAELPGGSLAAQAVAFAPGGRAVVTAGADGAVRVRDARTGRLLRVLPAHDGPATAVAF